MFDGIIFLIQLLGSVILIVPATILLIYALWSFTQKEFMKSVRYFCFVSSFVLYGIFIYFYCQNYLREQEYLSQFVGAYHYRSEGKAKITFFQDETFACDTAIYKSGKGEWHAYHGDGMSFFEIIPEGMFMEQMHVVTTNERILLKALNPNKEGRILSFEKIDE